MLRFVLELCLLGSAAVLGLAAFDRPANLGIVLSAAESRSPTCSGTPRL
jgi:hypothetical protein